MTPEKCVFSFGDLINMKIKNKGQMFLLGALIITGILVILRYNIAYPGAIEEKKALEVRLENEIFNNIMEEFNSTLRFSYSEPLNITSNVFDFANFTELKISEHSMLFKFLFVGSVANRTTNTLNVTLVNMLNQVINADFTLDGQSDSQSNIVNYETWDTNFTITPGNQYILTLTYDGTTENVTIKTKQNKDVYTGFFYVSLESEDATHTKLYQNYMNLE